MRTIPLLLAVLMLTACHGIRDRGLVPIPPKRTIEEPPRPVPEELPRIASVKTPPHAVEAPPEPTIPVVKTPAQIFGETNDKLLDVYFAYDRSELSPEALSALEKDAQLIAPLLVEIPGLKLLIEGHCDERGSAEYNLALGDRRASQVASALRSLDVPAASVETVSYGKERPQCEDPNEPCWRRNRRAHLVLVSPPTP